MSAIDLNVDIGEGGAHDEALLDYATSANIACGWHAGDAITIRRVAAAALARGIAIGAHPGYPDRENFGRRSMELDSGELYAGIQYQVGALAGIVKALGTRLSHVKPHGAMYNDAERDVKLACVIVEAIRDIDSTLAVIGLAGGQLVNAARAAGLRATDEVFADRRYTATGRLVPRSQPGALIEDKNAMCRQVMDMVSDERVRAADGTWVKIKADTVCLHGDGAQALQFACSIDAVLAEGGIRVIAREVIDRMSILT